MRRKKLKVSNEQISKLHECLKTGKSPVGLIGWVATDFYDEEQENIPIVIKVKIVELKADCNGVNVMVQPLAGAGTFKISPCKWFDTTKQFEIRQAEELKLQTAHQDYCSIHAQKLLSIRRERLFEYINSNGWTLDLLKELEAMGMQPDPTAPSSKWLSTVNEPNLSNLTKAFVCLVNGVSEQAYNDRH